MFIDAPADYVERPAFYVAAKDQALQTAKNKLPNKLGTCREYRANDTHPVRPVFAAEQYYLEFNKGPAVVAKVDNNLQIRTETYIQVVKQPDHGRLKLYMPNATAADGISKYDYHYIPEKDYVGLDNFEFRVSVDGESLSVFYQVKVFPEDENPNYIGYCNWPKSHWKISQDASKPTETTGHRPRFTEVSFRYRPDAN